MTMATTTMSTAAADGGTRPGAASRSWSTASSRRSSERPRRPSRAQSTARRVHEARRLRQQGDLDGALAVLAGADLTKATEREARWVYGEWIGIARRRFADREGAVVYSPGTGRAAVLAPHPGGALEVLAVLGDALGAGQARLAAQPAGPAAPREGRLVMVATHAPVDLAALKERHPLGEVVEAAGVTAARRGAASARASAPSTRSWRAASRSTPTRSASTASAAARAATCWTSSGAPRA